MSPFNENTVEQAALEWLRSMGFEYQFGSSIAPNALQVISDGIEARLGCLGAEFERFAAWKTVTGQEVLSESLETLVKGVFEKAWLLQLLRHFVTFEDDGKKITKKVAAYHQFHAVQKAVASVLEASLETAEEGKRGRGGVIWYTQGSGKSLTMTFFAGKLVLELPPQNPHSSPSLPRPSISSSNRLTFSSLARK